MVEVTRAESRKDILEAAHEGHEEYHPVIQPVEVGPKSWYYQPRFRGVLIDWHPSERTLTGLVVILIGWAVVLILVAFLVVKYLS